MHINRRRANAIILLLTQILTVAQCFSHTHRAETTVFNNKLSLGLQTAQHEDSDDSNYPLHSSRRSLIINTVTSALAASSILAPPPYICAATNPAAAASATTASKNVIPEWTLEGGVKFPTLALNTVGLSAEETSTAVALAIKSGITHVDFHPGKERDGVAAYLRNNPRDGLFLNTKIRKAPPGTSPSEAARRTRDQISEDLDVLGVKSVDMLMLRDSPDPDVIRAQWAVLEEALKSGKTRSIGVINFCRGALEAVLESAKVTPALNYYMLHVGMGRDAHGLRPFGEGRGIRTFAYGCLGEPGPNEGILKSDVLKRVGDAHGGKSPEEVALRWVVQGGAAASVRPTTEFGLGVSSCRGSDGLCEKGINKRVGCFSWSLTDNEMAELDALTSPDDNPTLFSSSGCPGAFVMPK